MWIRYSHAFSIAIEANYIVLWSGEPRSVFTCVGQMYSHIESNFYSDCATVCCMESEPQCNDQRSQSSTPPCTTDWVSHCLVARYLLPVTHQGGGTLYTVL